MSWGGSVSDFMLAEDIAYTAQWQVVSYAIVCDYAGGMGGNPSGYTVKTPEITLNQPIRFGYTFVGWTGTGLTAPTKTVIIPAGSTGNRYYTAVWVKD